MTPKLPGRPGANRRCVLFDWGDTLMRVFPDEVGPMWRWHRVEAVDGVAAALERIRPHAMIGLATNAADSAEGDIWKALRRVDLERRFDRCYCFATVGYRKPHPAFFRAIIEDTGVEAAATFFVGDDFAGDVMGATEASLRAIWFNERTSEIRRGDRIGRSIAWIRSPRSWWDWGSTRPHIRPDRDCSRR